MKKPKVTIVIPVYNSQEYIGRCLDSVLSQTFQDFEILVINDGSKDDTGKIVREYVKNDKRIRYIEQKNMGVARTRNKAIKLAKGEFIAFIDNDDYIDEDYLERLMPRSGEDLVLGGYRRPDSDGKVIKTVKLENAEWSKFIVPTPWAKICRRDYLLEHKILFLDNNIGEDVYFNLLAVLGSNKIRITDYVGYNWFVNKNSVSNTKQKRYERLDVFGLLDGCYDELKKRALLESNYQILELFFFRYIVWFLLFAGKRANIKEISRIYDSLFGWLKKRFPDFAKNKLLKGELPGEIKSTRLVYEIFLRFYRVGLGKVLVWCYAKL